MGHPVILTRSARRMEEGVLGADFRDKMRAIYGDRQFDCEVTCDNGASFATSFSRHSIESGVGGDVSFDSLKGGS